MLTIIVYALPTFRTRSSNDLDLCIIYYLQLRWQHSLHVSFEPHLVTLLMS